MEQINRNKFEEFGIDQQVKLINEWLKSGSLNEIAQRLGYKYESSIRKRFKKAGYERRGKKFVLIEDNREVQEPQEQEEKTVIIQPETTTKQLQDNYKVSKVSKVSKSTTGQRLDKLENELQQIKELLQNNYTITTTSFNLYRSNSKAVSRSYRVYPEVLEKLEQVKSKYPEFSLQDIFNSLLMEALGKYTD